MSARDKTKDSRRTKLSPTGGMNAADIAFYKKLPFMNLPAMSKLFLQRALSLKSQKGDDYMARNSNKLLVPGVEQFMDQVKYEIAQEFGVTLGSDTVSRANGSVGGEITKRLVQQAQAQLSGQKQE